MKRKKKFNVVKQVKSLSRVLVKARPGTLIQSKKRKLLEKIGQRETRT